MINPPSSSEPGGAGSALGARASGPHTSEAGETPALPGARPTNIRRHIIAVSMLMAFILYLDRICMGEIVKSASFNHELGLTQQQTGRILGAFFFAYALLQVPAGWASDRFGARAMLTLYI